MRKLLFLSIFILFVSKAAALTRCVQYVDPSATGANNGTSWTDAWTHLKTCEAQDLQLDDADECIEIFTRGGEDNQCVTWSGWGTDGTHTIKVIADPNRDPNGAWDAGAYTMIGYPDTTALTINQDYIEFDGVQFDGKSDIRVYGAIAFGTASEVKVHNCKFRNWTRSSAYTVVFNYGYGTPTGARRWFYNNIMWDCATSVRVWMSQAYLAHNTIVNSAGAGIELIRNSFLDAVVQGNLIIGSGTSDYLAVFTGGTLDLANNYTSDLTSPNGAKFRNAAPVWLDEENDDYRLAEASAAYFDDCTDQSGSYFPDDIDGQLRSHWDAGAHETVEGEEPPEPPAPPVPMDYWISPSGSDDANGLSRETPWATMRYALWHVPDADVNLFLLEGDYGAIELRSLVYYGYPERTHYVTIRPDPLNSEEAIIRKLDLSDLAAAMYLRFDHVRFEAGPTQIGNGSSLIFLHAGHHVEFVDCNVVGIIGPIAGDPRPHASGSTCYLMSINEVDIGTIGVPKTTNVLVQRCTFRRAWCGPYLSLTCVGLNVRILDNDVAETSAYGITVVGSTNPEKNGLAGAPYTDWPLIQGNYIHNQARVWQLDYSDKAHGTGLAPSAGRVRCIGNVIRCYGTTASIRNYPSLARPTPSMSELYLENNLVLNPLNYGMELYLLSSGSKVLHNTIIGVREGGTGRYYWGYPTNHYPGGIWFSDYGVHDPFDVSNVQVCNNICLGYNGQPLAGSIYTGNVIWSMAGSHTQTELNTSWPGNKLYCASVGADMDDDANAVTFTTEGTFFWGGELWENAYAGMYVDDANIYRVIGDDVEPGHTFDLSETSDAINFGNASYSVATDAWGGERDSQPDSGRDEYPDPPAPPEPPGKWFFWRKSQ